MIELRWVVLLALWSMLIGPIVDLTQNPPTAPAARAKTVQISKGRPAR